MKSKMIKSDPKRKEDSVFDQVVERAGSGSIKWDLCEPMAGAPDLIPLWVADMDFPSPPEVVAALQRRVRHGIFGYSLRPDSYDDAVIGWMKKRFQWEIRKEWIAFAPGVVPALSFALQAFTQAGDAVVVQPPVYTPFMQVVEINGRRLLVNPLRIQDGRYEMDLQGLERIVDGQTRMLILCSPHNPVGRVWKKQELAALAKICRSRDLIVVSDEIHSDLVMSGHRHVPLASISPEVADRTITCTAPSKTFNIPGLQMANVIISDGSLRRRFNHAVSVAGVGLSNVFGIAATEAAYTRCEKWLAELLDYIEGNYRFLVDFCCRRLPKIKVHELEGTYLAWVDFSGYGMKDQPLENLLKNRARVWLSEGYRFGPGGEGFQRINLACPRRVLAEALERIAAALTDPDIEKK